MLSTKQAIEALQNRAIRELKERGKIVTEETLFTNKAFLLFFLKLLVRIDNDWPKMGLFHQTNKEALIKYKNATLLLKQKIKKGIKYDGRK